MKFFIYFLSINSLLFFSCNNTSKSSVPEDTEKEVVTDLNLLRLDSLIEVAPRDAKNYYNRAKYYDSKGNYPKALADAYSALHLDSANISYISLNAELYLKNNEGDKAIKTISKGINLNEDNEILYEKAIEYNLYMKHYEAALNFANDLLRINKYNANAYFLKGLINKEINNINKAISSFQTCVEIDPLFYNAYMQLALIFDNKRDFQAIQYFDNALRVDSSSREAYYGKAYFYQKNGEINQAIKVYKTMLMKDPKDSEVLFNIGYCYMNLDSLEKAYTNFDLATKIQPQYTGAYYMKAYVSELGGDYFLALKNYEQAKRLLPNDTTIQAAIERVKTNL